MSRWNGYLESLKHMSIHLGETEEKLPLPDWAAFLSWAGFWMATNHLQNGHVLMVILLPTRVCASAFCLFGGLLGRASQSSSLKLSFSDFAMLKEGTNLYLTVHKNKIKGVLKGDFIFSDARGRIIKPVSGGKQFQNSSIYIHEKNFPDYKISQEPHSSAQADKRLSLVESYYQKILGDVSRAWIRTGDIESVLWTNKARWKKELSEFKLIRNQLLPIALEDLLLLQNNRVLLKSPRSATSRYHDCSFAILDGPETISRVDKLKARNRILILDRSEYSPIIETRIAELSNFRNDSLLDVKDFKNVMVPHGAEVMTFAIGG